MKQTLIRILTGLIITAIGIGALLGALHLVPFGDWFGTWWPLLVIIGGLFVFAGDWRRNATWGTALVTTGALLQLKQLGYLEFNIFSLVLPILIIAAGLSVLLHTKSRPAVAANSNDVDNISVIFSGSETTNKSKAYKGGKITAVFGGTTLDLRDAKLTGEATLDVFVFCAGIELKVPRDWRVVVKAAPVAGGVENKSEGADDHKSPVLVLTGVVALGGVEVKT